ncbi:MAG: M56 family metallopeptidase [Hungatella sp.]|nr:M56 family metallopeptidase [Hungatella sp.]
MIEGFTLLLVITLAGSILFSMLCFIDILFGKIYVRQIYNIAKVVCVCYLLSIFTFYYILFHVINRVEIGIIDSPNVPDFSRWIIVYGTEYLGLFLGKSIILSLMNFWLLAFLVLMISSLITSHLLTRKLKNQSSVILDNRLNIFLGLKKELGIKRDIQLYENPYVKTPLLAGIVYPFVLLPCSSYEERQWEMFLRHELCHYVSHDLWYRLILDLVQKIHWFNPAIYFFALKFYDMSELACDSVATKDLTMEQKGQYARLLSSVSYQSRETAMLAGFCGNSYKRAERRVYNIMRYEKTKLSVAFLAAIIVFVCSVPMVSYASIMAVQKVETKIIDDYANKRDVIETMEPIYELEEVLEVADADIILNGSIVVN